MEGTAQDSAHGGTPSAVAFVIDLLCKQTGLQEKLAPITNAFGTSECNYCRALSQGLVWKQLLRSVIPLLNSMLPSPALWI